MYVITEFYSNGQEWDDESHDEVPIIIFKELEDALNWGNKKFNKIEACSYKYIYSSEIEKIGEDITQEDYVLYNIYKVDAY